MLTNSVLWIRNFLKLAKQSCGVWGQPHRSWVFTFLREPLMKANHGILGVASNQTNFNNDCLREGKAHRSLKAFELRRDGNSENFTVSSVWELWCSSTLGCLVSAVLGPCLGFSFVNHVWTHPSEASLYVPSSSRMKSPWWRRCCWMPQRCSSATIRADEKTVLAAKSINWLIREHVRREQKSALAQ